MKIPVVKSKQLEVTNLFNLTVDFFYLLEFVVVEF